MTAILFLTKHALKLFSIRNFGVVFLLFAMVCGIATFVENAYSTEVAKSVVYDSKWFEFILLFALLSLMYNCFVFKLFSLKKLPLGLFHGAFIIIILGAGITRYTGKEGRIHIREGETVNYYIQQDKSEWIRTSLPFALQLRNFEIDYYPGSEMPSEYRSQVTLIRKDKQPVDVCIYMNHILKYRGYRFYQFSYDNDQRGTILSVNHDPWGIGVTYTGYVFMFLGMLLSLFSKNSRFHTLLKELRRYRSVVCVLFLFAFPLIGKSASTVNSSCAKTFGQLWVNDGKGRVMPMNTLNTNLLLKVHHERTYNDCQADEVVLSIMMYPLEWKNEPIIYVEKNIAKKFNINSQYVSSSFFSEDTTRQQLISGLQTALNKPSSELTKTEKSIINLSERLNVFNMISKGHFFNVYCVEKQWYSPFSLSHMAGSCIFKLNSQLLSAMSLGDDEKLNACFLKIEEKQQADGQNVLPSLRHRNVELIYNRLNIFERIAPYYATIAVLLLLISISMVFGKEMSKSLFTLKLLLLFGFVLQTLGVVMRWYISGRVPMGNGYESIVMVSWISLAGGFLLSKKSPITLAVSTVLACATLLVAHINTMNPEITVLVPVLNSYWLSIHVASVMAAYALLGLCALLGFFNLLFTAFFYKKESAAIIRELTIISKILMIVGLYLLTIGCFIGAIWANESWGHYWSWDPKETWCLISIVIYAFVVHMHHLPHLSGDLVYNIASVWSFGAILMTYFGVNYFLGGMHSYAGGEAPDFPVWGWLLVIGLLLLSMKAILVDRQSECGEE